MLKVGPQTAAASTVARSPAAPPPVASVPVQSGDSFLPSGAAAKPSVDPSADLLPSLGSLDPLTYHTADDSRLPYELPSERTFSAAAQAQATPREVQAAKALSEVGQDQLWSQYAREYEQHVGPARAA